MLDDAVAALVAHWLMYGHCEPPAAHVEVMWQRHLPTATPEVLRLQLASRQLDLARETTFIQPAVTRWIIAAISEELARRAAP